MAGQLRVGLDEGGRLLRAPGRSASSSLQQGEQLEAGLAARPGPRRARRPPGAAPGRAAPARSRPAWRPPRRAAPAPGCPRRVSVTSRHRPGVAAAADPAAQLVQLRHPEPVGVHDRPWRWRSARRRRPRSPWSRPARRSARRRTRASPRPSRRPAAGRAARRSAARAAARRRASGATSSTASGGRRVCSSSSDRSVRRRRRHRPSSPASSSAPRRRSAGRRRTPGARPRPPRGRAPTPARASAGFSAAGTTCVAIGDRPAGSSVRVETSRSPNTVMATVRGIGVAVITSTCGACRWPSRAARRAARRRTGAARRPRPGRGRRTATCSCEQGVRADDDPGRAGRRVEQRLAARRRRPASRSAGRPGSPCSAPSSRPACPSGPSRSAIDR